MGGKALLSKGIETKRLSTFEFDVLAHDVHDVLNRYYPARVPPCYRSKSTHGDLDICIQLNSDTHRQNLRDIIEREFSPRAIVKNGVVLSFDYKDFQVDVISVPERNWETTLDYLSYNDLGNLVGRLVRSMGKQFKYGIAGLEYVYVSDVLGKTVGEVTISKSTKDIYEFLGLDYEQFRQGFDDLEDIFRFIQTSRFYRKSLFDFSEDNHRRKERDQKRTTITLFSQWVNDHPVEDNPKLTTEVCISLVSGFFTESNLLGRIEEYRALEGEIITFRGIFNGREVIKRYDLEGSAIGRAISNFEKSFSGKKEMREWVNQNPDSVWSHFESVNPSLKKS